VEFGGDLLGLALLLAFVFLWVLSRVGFRRTASRARQPPVVDRIPFEGRVWVIDGDTLSVQGKRIRMFGIDAPELSQYGGYKARSHLIRLIGGKWVRVQPVDVDCYGRVVARVWYGDIDLSDRMVRDGYAVASSRWHSDYDAAERDARVKQCGLWCRDLPYRVRDPAAHRRWKAQAGRDSDGFGY